MIDISPNPAQQGPLTIFDAVEALAGKGEGDRQAQKAGLPQEAPSNKAAEAEQETPEASESVETEAPADDPAQEAEPADGEPEQESEDAELEADDGASEADEEADYEDTEADDPEDIPAIDPPSSWKARDKTELWPTLDPAVQVVIAERENGRDTAVNRAVNEAAEARKSAQAEQEQAAAERQQQQETLNQLVPVLQASVLVDFPDVQSQQDLYALRQADPDRYNLYIERSQAIQATVGYNNQLLQAHKEDAEKKAKAYVQEAERRQVEAIPEWRDGDLAKKEREELKDYLVDAFGVSRETLANMHEPWHFQILRKAQAFDRAQVAKAKARAKKVPKRVAKPGTPKSKARRATDAKAARRKQVEGAKSIDDVIAAYRKS